MTPSLVSYTVPCHKRQDDLFATLPSVIEAANFRPPVEIVVVDYGNHETFYVDLSNAVLDLPAGLKKENALVVKRVDADYFHMAHARNVGIRAATGDIVVAFLADQRLDSNFFHVVRGKLKPGRFLKWHETFAFHREDILAAGGFDERMEFYGPEGKELTDRLQRRGLRPTPIPSAVVSQIPTPDSKKLAHYREKMSKQRMHDIGMEVWRENQLLELTVANSGREWGAHA